MMQSLDSNIMLKQKLDINNYEDVKDLQTKCLQYDQTSLKLELDYKLNKAEIKNINRTDINEFMYYDENNLVGYIGICCFGGSEIEINGMVHPDYRRRGIFTQLFSYVNEEWDKKEYNKILLLCDHDSISGQEFMKHTGAVYHHSEYEMFLRDDSKKNTAVNHIVLRKAMNQDAKEIARQNSIYFEEDMKEDEISMPEEEEKCGLYIFIAEADGKTIGKVHLEINDQVGGIYGLGVITEYRKRGYGREILLQSIKVLTEKGSKEIMLQVATKNKNALNLYQSCGFEETSTMDYFEIVNQ